MRICRIYTLCHCYFYSGAFYLCFSPTSLGFIALSKNPLQLFAILFFVFLFQKEFRKTNLLILFVVHFFTDFLLLSLEFWLKTNRSNKLKLLYLFFWGLKRCLCGWECLLCKQEDLSLDKNTVNSAICVCNPGAIGWRQGNHWGTLASSLASGQGPTLYPKSKVMSDMEWHQRSISGLWTYTQVWMLHA